MIKTWELGLSHLSCLYGVEKHVCTDNLKSEIIFLTNL